MGKELVTIKDIAEIAGVSFSTVSRCLNDSPLVSEKTKKRVGEIAQELNFEFNSSARGLITRQVGTVGIVLPEKFTELHVNFYQSMLLNTLRTNLEKRDVDMIVTYQKNHYTGKNNISRLVTRGKVDGLIMLTEHLEEETLKFLSERQVPFVCGHYPPSDLSKDQDVIYTDHYWGGTLVADYLLAKGYRSFTLLEVQQRHLEFQLRAQGFTDTVSRVNAQLERIQSSFNFVSARNAAGENIEKLMGTEAVFCLNDLMAYGTIRALHDAGAAVPEDIAVVGYDDSEYGECFSPPLTTVHQPKEALAEKICDRLFLQIEQKKLGTPFEKQLFGIKPELVIRDSA